MKHCLTEADKVHLEKRIAEAEKNTNAQIVFATALRCDSYPEIPWKAFSITASLTGLIVFIAGYQSATWTDYRSVLVSIVITLGAAATSVILAEVFPFFGRLFLSQTTSDKETRQYAESLFIEREVFATGGRKGILVLVSKLERKVVILPDKGLRDILDENELKRIISNMKPFLGNDEFRKAFDAALDELVKILVSRKAGDEYINELSDRIIEGKES